MTLTVAPADRPASPIGEAAARRVCILSEDLSPPPDEGVKKLALALAGAVGQHHKVALLSTRGAAPPSGRLARSSRAFLSVALRRELRRIDPEILIYVSRSSTTFMAFLRSRVLRAHCPRALVVLVGLQARRHTWLQRSVL